MKIALIIALILLSSITLAESYPGVLSYNLQTISNEHYLTPFGSVQKLPTDEVHTLAVQVSEDGSFQMPLDQYQVESNIYTVGVLDPSTSDFYQFTNLFGNQISVQSEAGGYTVGYELEEGCNSYSIMTGGLPLSAQFPLGWMATGVNASTGQLAYFSLIDGNVPLMPVTSLNLNVCYNPPEYLGVLNYTFEYDSQVPDGFPWSERGYWNIRVKKKYGEWKASLTHTHLESFFLAPLINVSHPVMIGSENLTASKYSSSFSVALGEANSNPGKNHILSIETRNPQTDEVKVVEQPFQNSAKMAISLLARRYGVNANLPIGVDSWIFAPAPAFSMSLNWSMFEVYPDE
ncbi:MAG: hypothetical protein HN353_12465 [Bdellovibrionales bacterium]|jgi:hypothetical protein|nr:hypothetical protein [Bdellovibrionales bacterium]MBT3526329.1 hypothetical protein [Bdellovibrionales bacterium]MBT7670673.1 hypothetical protein [Bdellovibrionales bacterium]MBT7766742.1 hypothetical protein [Bdellovibrionales bacterium]